jgi:hypothetical protein
VASRLVHLPLDWSKGSIWRGLGGLDILSVTVTVTDLVNARKDVEVPTKEDPAAPAP